jgi:hypothetical protein
MLLTSNKSWTALVILVKISDSEITKAKSKPINTSDASRILL